jgi:hypothetical protein
MNVGSYTAWNLDMCDSLQFIAVFIHPISVYKGVLVQSRELVLSDYTEGDDGSFLQLITSLWCHSPTSTVHLRLVVYSISFARNQFMEVISNIVAFWFVQRSCDGT